MIRALVLLAAILAGCNNGCERGPQTSDYIGCAAACGMRGVADVTFTRCRCQGDVAAVDGGVR